jgi:hypothetical protein
VQAVLAQGAPFTLRASGSSMFPFIRDGDLVTLSPAQGWTPRRGDVVAFVGQAGRALLIHRIVGEQGERYLLKGDATSGVDGWVCSEQILGFVSRVDRGGKRVHLGLGREKSWIAWLTLRRLPFPRLLPVWTVVRRTLRAGSRKQRTERTE